MNATLVITHGLPGSGKTTMAMEKLQEDPQNVIRANRDDIREKLFGASYHSKTPDKKSEQQVSQVQQEIIKQGLRENKTVIVDDTNLNTRRIKPLLDMAKKYNAKIEQIHANVPIEECKRRNKKRGDAGGRRVPEFVIDQMAENAYSKDGQLKEFVIAKNGNVFAVDRVTPGMKKIDFFNTAASAKNPIQGKGVVFLDMDGTLFNNEIDSARYLSQPGQKKDFHNFYVGIKKAPVNQAVLQLANNLRKNDGLNIFAVTGRSDDYADALIDALSRSNVIDALSRSNVNVSQLIMKREGDFRPSSEHKEDTVRKVREQGLAVVYAIDDRDQDLQMFNRLDVPTAYVNKPVIDPLNIPDSVPEPTVNTVYGSGYCIRCGSYLKNGGNIGKVCATKVNL